MTESPITFADVLETRRALREHLTRTPLRRYAELDRAVGHGVRVFVKHENHQPTNSFKARNGLALLSAVTEGERGRGFVAATRGNHGLGLAWAGALLGVPVALCVPLGNNPEKNAAMRGYGADVIEEGRDYDEALEVAVRLAGERGWAVAHSTNDRRVLAGAGTMTLEIVEEQPGLEALVIAVGGGSQAVGALTVARALNLDLAVYAVQAEGASACHDAWRECRGRSPSVTDLSHWTQSRAETFADGIATRGVYELTFPALCAGLAGFVTVSDAEIAESIRLLLRSTHNLVEGAAAAGLAGLLKLRDELAGKSVGIILTGGNIDADTLRRVVTCEL